LDSAVEADHSLDTPDDIATLIVSLARAKFTAEAGDPAGGRDLLAPLLPRAASLTGDFAVILAAVRKMHAHCTGKAQNSLRKIDTVVRTSPCTITSLSVMSPTNARAVTSPRTISLASPSR